MAKTADSSAESAVFVFSQIISQTLFAFFRRKANICKKQF